MAQFDPNPMDDPSLRNPAYLSLTDQQLSEIDALCDRFDRELLNGDAPRIEAFLAEAPEAARDGLLAELLAMEFEYRTQRGDEPQQDQFVQRFPHQVSVIAGVFTREAAKQLPGNDKTSVPGDKPPLLADFRLIEEIGRGGMGVVWLAEQVAPVKRRVALKLIKSELPSKEVMARFDAEKQALAMMDHPNIARVLDAGATGDGRPYFVMEFVDGTPITQYCDDNKLSVDERLNLFVSGCKAVQHAHQKGIIHRDLKPSNVLVTVSDGEAIPRVIDFGLAKAVEQNLPLTDATLLTEIGKVVGTVQYMSPEQAELKGPDAADIDTRTDVYSLGVMLYELLTGSTPVDKATLGQNALLEVLQIIREVDPPRPSSRLSSSSHEVNAAVSDLRRLHPARLQQLLRGELDWVVMKALEKDRARRYQTAQDLAQDLSNYLTGQTVTARPPSTWYQVQKFANRNRGLVVAVLAIGVALLAGIAGTSYGLIRANQKTQLAEGKTREAEDERGKAKASEDRAEGEAQRAHDSEARATFQLAVARYDADRAAEARSLLHQVPPEYRENFEWHYCNRRFQGSDITCYGHAGDVNKVAFTPDGARVVSASSDGTIKFWDSTSGQELATIDGHEGGIVALAVSSKGSHIASAGPDKLVKLWDVESRRELFTLSGHSGLVRSVAFSPSGEGLASASDDGTVRLWNVATGKEVTTITGHAGAVLGVGFSPDGKCLASVGRDKLIRIWDARSGVRITELTWHGIEVQSVAFSPDGTRLIASSYVDATLWDAQTWQFIAETGHHDGMVHCVAFSPDGTLVATAGDDWKIKLWSARSGMSIRTLSGHAGRVYGLAFSPAGSRLVSGSRDRTVKLWDMRGENDLTLEGPRDGTAVAFSADGRQLASSTSKGVIFLRAARTCETLFTLQGHMGFINELAFSPDGSQIVSAGDDRTIRLWDTRTGEEVAVLRGHTSWVRGIAFSPDGTRLASAGWDGALKLWDAQTHEEINTLKGHRGGLYCVAFSPDGSRLASGGSDKTAKLWDARTGAEIRTFTGHTGVVRSVAFGPRGERLATGGYDTKARVWDVASGKQLATASVVPSGVVSGLAFSPDGRRIATVGTDKALRLFDALSGQEIMTLNVGTSRRVTFSPDGARLAVVPTDGPVRVLEAPQKHETAILSGHTDTLSSVTFSPDGSRIYSESEHEKLVWDVATRKKIQDAVWDPPEASTLISPDGRWYVTFESNNIVLVDREYKNTPDEKAWRRAKARFDPLWHQRQANAATLAGNWYAAAFHYAWLLKHELDSLAHYVGLQRGLDRLAASGRPELAQCGQWLGPVDGASLWSCEFNQRRPGIAINSAAATRTGRPACSRSARTPRLAIGTGPQQDPRPRSWRRSATAACDRRRQIWLPRSGGAPCSPMTAATLAIGEAAEPTNRLARTSDHKRSRASATPIGQCIAESRKHKHPPTSAVSGSPLCVSVWNGLIARSGSPYFWPKTS